MTNARSQGARAKLRAHFLANLGRVMDSNELRAVAGNINEWARRVRELRTQEGYLILTHNDRSDLKPGEYLLETPKPQPAFARAMYFKNFAVFRASSKFKCSAILTMHAFRLCKSGNKTSSS